MHKGRLVIIGAGGHGKVAADVAELDGWREIVFLDDRFGGGFERHSHWRVVGCVADAETWQADAFFVAVGDGEKRSELTAELPDGAPLATLVHPSAVVSRYVHIEPGTLLCPRATVNVDTRIGKGVIVNTGASVDHDCHIGDFVHVCPGAALAGGVSVGASSWVGIGASVRQGISIGSGVVVGAGAVVVSDVADNTVVMGVPAKPTSW